MYFFPTCSDLPKVTSQTQKDVKSQEKKPEVKKTESGSKPSSALSSQEPVFGMKTGSDFSFAAIAAKSPPGGFGFAAQNTGTFSSLGIFILKLF